MHLRDYLCNPGDLSALARKLNIEPTTLRRWKLGRVPTLAYATAIEEATAGAVPVSSWLSPKSTRTKRAAKRPARRAAS